MKLIALQTKTKKNFKKNLDKLLELIEKCEDGSFILAPELCLTGFSYDRMDEASEFAIKAKKKIKKLSQNKTIALTFIEKRILNITTLYIFFIREKLSIVSQNIDYSPLVMSLHILQRVN